MVFDASPAAEARQPRYQTLRDQLALRITQGEWAPGSAIPAESELAGEYGVALGTMRRALEMLMHDGLVVRLHGKGTFVRDAMPQSSMLRFFRFRDVGSPDVPASVIHDLRKVQLPDGIATRLSAGRSRAGLWILRSREYDTQTALVEHIWLRLAPFRKLLTLDHAAFGPLLYPVYREQCGVVVARAHEEIRFDVLDARHARLLGLKAGHPAAVIERVAYDLAGTPVEFRITQGDAHRFHYSIDIR